jgi:hypothetical protein
VPNASLIYPFSGRRNEVLPDSVPLILLVILKLRPGLLPLAWKTLL